MNIYLIRHAKAGNRLDGYQDRYRPLIDQGRKQADQIDLFFADKQVDQILTSPAVRCRQTMEPLSSRLSLPAVETDELWEDSLPTNVIALMNASTVESLVLCSHGNLIPLVVSILHQAGTAPTGAGGSKGSIWSIEGEPPTWANATYHSPKELEI